MVLRPSGFDPLGTVPRIVLSIIMLGIINRRGFG